MQAKNAVVRSNATVPTASPLTYHFWKHPHREVQIILSDGLLKGNTNDQEYSQ
jgi:hypothetical protein